MNVSTPRTTPHALAALALLAACGHPAAPAIPPAAVPASSPASAPATAPAPPAAATATAPAPAAAPNANTATPNANPAAPNANTAAPAANTATAAAAATPSLYDLPAHLEDQDGGRIALDVWRGHPTVIALFYASCPQACPLLINNIKYALEGLTAAERRDVRVLLVSLEPDDGPEALRGVIKRHQLDRTTWRLTRTDADTVRDLAAVLGVAYRKLDDGSYNHASVITLLDATGHVLVQADGMTRNREVLPAALRTVR